MNFFHKIFNFKKFNLFVNSRFDYLVIISRFIAFNQKLLAPSLYLRDNFFVLKFHMLACFFFPVILIVVMMFDSYLTLDFVFFYYVDESDFDDFIVMIYMVLFSVIMLSDYDVNIDNNNSVVDFASVFSMRPVGDVSFNFAYYNEILLMLLH
jgi:hypothetical protein